MYVWVDALTNYLTAVGYPDVETEAYKRFWPADVHIIGKDIVRFHAVYWPALLMSAGIRSPGRYSDTASCSTGARRCRSRPGTWWIRWSIAQRFGVDQLRYFLLRDVTFGQDGSYSAEAIVTRVNADLANSFGNLAQRTLSFIAKNCDGVLPVGGKGDPADEELLVSVKTATRSELCEAFADLALSRGIEAWLRAVFACNQYIDAQAPWTLRKTDPSG
jgi:methionyl-tRNA synthetase